MYRTTITVAGLNIGIEHIFEHFRKFAKDFVVDNKNEDFVVSISNDDIETERNLVEEQNKKDAEHFDYTDEMLEETAIYRKIADNLSKYNAVVFHGSAVAIGEKAVLFTANSGVGKTTQAILWLKNIKDSYAINGDKPILRLMNENIYVCGTPWKGKEGMGTNANVPLTAICKINRSQNNHIEKLNASSFLPVLLSQSYHPNNCGSIFEMLPIIERITKSVSFYNLYCNTDDSSALLAYKEMMP